MLGIQPKQALAKKKLLARAGKGIKTAYGNPITKGRVLIEEVRAKWLVR